MKRSRFKFHVTSFIILKLSSVNMSLNYDSTVTSRLKIRVTSLTITDFKIRDAKNAVADKGLGLERRRLRGKSKVKIPVSMQDNAAAN